MKKTLETRHAWLIPEITATPLWTAKCAKNIDELSIKEFRIPERILMHEAGTAVAEAARSLGKKILILAGRGNNGGDAAIAGRILAEDPKIQITIIAEDVDQVPSIEGFPNIRIAPWSPESALNLSDDTGFDCIIDGITGLGLNGTLRPESPASKMLDLGNNMRIKNGLKVLAVDLPSGLNCDDTSQTIAPMPANATVTFGCAKAVHLIAPSRDLCGQVTIAPLSFHPTAIKRSLQEYPPNHAVVNSEAILRENPWNALPKSAHKFNRGHVLVIGGSPGKTGAPILSAMASLRSGAGWATIAIPHTGSGTPEIPPELTTEDLWKRSGTKFSVDAKKLSRLIEQRQVRSILIGPGTMESPMTPDVLRVLAEFSNAGGFVTLDAAATSHMVDLIQKHRSRFSPERSVMTPHPGEWKKLSKKIPPTPGSDKALRDVQQICRDAGFHLIFKNATPALFGPDDFQFTADSHNAVNGAQFESYRTKTLICNSGDATLARAGSGDVLGGIIAAHGGIGCHAAFAAIRGLSLLAAASQLAAKDVGKNAVLATDIIHKLGIADNFVPHD